MTYYLVFATEYLMTSEGTEIRTNRSFAAIESGMNTLAPDGMPLNQLYSTYAQKPADLPNVDTVRKGLNVSGSELMALRAAQPAQDYTGPVLFEARAAAPLVAQSVGTSNQRRHALRCHFSLSWSRCSGNLGGKAIGRDALERAYCRTSVTLVDDPSAKDYNGTPLIGGYAVDDEGVRAQKVTLVENGNLKEMLMSRRPGNESNQSNGHGRSALAGGCQADDEQFIFQSKDTMSPAELKKKFLDECKSEKAAVLRHCAVDGQSIVELAAPGGFLVAAGKLWRRRRNGRPVAIDRLQDVSRKTVAKK